MEHLKNARQNKENTEISCNCKEYISIVWKGQRLTSWFLLTAYGSSLHEQQIHWKGFICDKSHHANHVQKLLYSIWAARDGLILGLLLSSCLTPLWHIYKVGKGYFHPQWLIYIQLTVHLTDPVFNRSFYTKQPLVSILNSEQHNIPSIR